MKRRGILGVFLLSSALAVSAITFSFAKKNVVEYKGVVLPEVGNPEELGYAEPAYSSNLPNSQVYTSSPNNTETNNFTNYIGLLNFGEMRNHYRGDSVKVAVIDSGCNYTHQDFILNGNCVLSEDSASFLLSDNEVVTTKVKNGSSVDFSIIDDDNTTHDGHGTAVCGTIVGQINSLSSMGVAPNVELVVCKTNYQFAEIQTAINYCITHDVDIINMSIQSYVTTVNYNGETSKGLGSKLPDFLQPYIDAAYESGITVIAAGGNYNTSEKSYPANNDHVLAVGALAKGSKTSKAAYSNTGTNVEVVGPGTVMTASATYDNSTREINGTSFASPAVAGVAALYKQQNPSADPDEIMNAIKNSCTLLGNRNYFGDGAVNVDWLLTPIEDITLNVSSLNLDLNETKTLSISSITPSNACTNMMYLSGDESIAYADIETGEVKGIGVGNTTIYACSLKDDNYSFEIPVSVTDSTIHVNSISLIEGYSNEQEIKVGDKISLPTKFNVLPSNSTNKNVTYELNVNEGVLSVDSNGLLTALKEGEEIVTITSVDNPKASLGIYYTVGPKDVSYTINIPFTSFSAGTSGTGSLSTATSSPITISISKGYRANDEERSYAGGSITVSGEYTNIKKITINHHGAFKDGQSLTSNPSTYSVSKSSSGGVYKYFIEGSGSSSVTITNSAQLKFTSIDVEYSLSGSGETEKTLESISASNAHRSFTVGDTFVKETITAYYSDGDPVDVTQSAVFSGYNMNNSGEQTVYVSYTDTYGTANTEYSINVSPATITTYTVTFNANGHGTAPNAVTVNAGEKVSKPSDLTATGWTFGGWYKESGCTTAYDFNTAVNGSFTLYAKWTETTSSDDFNGYYNGIDENSSTLLADLRTLNLSKRTREAGYSSMGTGTSSDPDDSPYMYTDYDPSTVRYNTKGQAYGTKILSFYSGISTTSWNKEHVWPASRLTGGRDHNVVDDDIYMARPTISSENSNRGNSVFYEGRVSQSDGWDPVTAFANNIGVYESIRGESARIIFYCMTVDPTLVLNDSTSNSGNNMGRLTDLLRWNLENPVNDRELTRQSGGQYLQGNRNAFVDHPEYACKIWGNTNDATRSICSSEPVTPKTLLSISYTGTPNKTTYTEGENFDPTGLTVTANYDDNTTPNITNNVTWTPSPLTYGTTSVTGTYQGKTITISGLTVNKSQTTNITITRDSVTTNSGYGWANWSQGGISGQVYYYGPTGGKIQMNGSKTGKALFSSSTNNKFIDSIIIKSAEGTPPFTVYGSDTAYTTANTTSGTSIGSKNASTSGVTWSFEGKEFKYFSIVLGGSSAGYISSVEVRYRNENTPKVNSISLPEKVDVDLYNESSYTFSPVIDAETGADTTITWKSSNTDVATISNSGVATLLKVGSTTITATCGGKNATCLLTVTDSTPKPVTSITVNNAPSSIEQNGYKDIAITVGPSNATDKSVTWNSSSSTITISNSSNTGARLTANGSVGAKATITITANDGSGVSTSFEVTIVEKKVLVGITYSGKTTYAVGSSMANNDGHLVYAQYSDGTEINVTSSATITGFDSSEEKLNKIMVSYTEDNVTKTTTQQLLILEDVNSGDGESYYEKVTSTADLNDGKYLIVYESGNVAFNGALTTLDAVSNTVSVNISNNRIEASDTINNAAFTFDSKNGSFLGSGGKYFGNNSNSNALTSSSTALTNTVTINENNVDIKSSGGSYLRYNAGGDQMRFRYYKSSSYTGQKAIQIYKYVQGQSSLSAEQKAKIYSASFLEAFTCDGSGAKAPTFASGITWSSLNTEYSKLDADTKALFTNATYTLSGSEVDATGETNIVIAYAVARYDFVVSKYGYDDFMQRGISSSRRAPIISISSLDTSTIIIASIAAAGIAAIGGYFFYKKRKEQ